MNPEANGHGAFRVSIPGTVASDVKKSLRIAIEAEEEDRAFAALAEINRKLENEPGTFGEPLFYLKSLNLEMRLGVVPPFSVTYGVNYSARTVFVSRVRMHL
jgi:hypothetical protein